MDENEQCLQTPVSPVKNGWMKKWLGRYLTVRRDIERGDPCSHPDVPRSHEGKYIFAALLVLLALLIMGLLFFWNYLCIMVWHMCTEDEEFPSSSSGDR